MLCPFISFYLSTIARTRDGRMRRFAGGFALQANDKDPPAISLEIIRLPGFGLRSPINGTHFSTHNSNLQG